MARFTLVGQSSRQTQTQASQQAPQTQTAPLSVNQTAGRPRFSMAQQPAQTQQAPAQTSQVTQPVASPTQQAPTQLGVPAESSGPDPLDIAQAALSATRSGLNLLGQATAPNPGDAPSTLNQGVNTATAGANLLSGLGNVAGSIMGDGNTVSRVATGLSGGLQAYQGADTLLGNALPNIPYAQYAAPLLSAFGSATGNSENAEMALAQGGLGLVRGALSMLGPGGVGAATLFAPAFENISDAIYQAFHEPSHQEREQLETGRAYAAGRGMLRDIGYATTPEELAEVLERYNTGFAGQHTITGLTDINAIMANPGGYNASIIAGVDPSRLTDANNTITRAVQGQAAVIAMARTGNPQAIAYLDKQRQAGGDFRAEMLRLLPPGAMGYGAGGQANEDPYIAALRHLAGAYNNPEMIRQRAPGVIASLTENGLNPELAPQLISPTGSEPAPINVSSYGVVPKASPVATPQYVANAAQAMGLPLDNGVATPLLASQVASLNGQNNYYIPPTEDTMRLPDAVAAWAGFPIGTVLPIQEAQRFIGDFGSGGA